MRYFAIFKPFFAFDQKIFYQGDKNYKIVFYRFCDLYFHKILSTVNFTTQNFFRLKIYRKNSDYEADVLEILFYTLKLCPMMN